MNCRNIRRVLALLLMLAMCFALCACGAEPEVVVTPMPTTTPEPTPEPTPVPTPEPTPEPIVGEILTDDDGDGIIDYKFHYNGATVYALIVLDPNRVYVGTALPEPSNWGRGVTLDVMAQNYGAVAGINAGGFVDVSGAGSGWPPAGITYSKGVNFNSTEGGIMGALDVNDHMWVGHYDYNDCETFRFRDAVTFGPVLVGAGEKTDPSTYETGIGARTAIGQREDGSMVLVVVDGRQGYSIGITFEDLANIMVDKFGCVNATSMDGGNSSCMYYNGQAVNRSSNQAPGTRDLPDAWLVDALPEGYVKPEGVPEFIVLDENPVGEHKEYAYQCDEETGNRLYEFAKAFTNAYYGYFGTKNSNYYYPMLRDLVVPESELRSRIELALMDRMWVNTWGTECKNLVLDGAYANDDGSYDIIVTSDIFEYASYWSYEALGTTLRITVVPDETCYLGYRAIATF